MKKKKPSHKGLVLKMFIVIVLAVLIGLCIAFCIFEAVDRQWIESAICLAVAIGLFIIACPLYYLGDMYECPKCGHKFKVNPYKVFFTNGILGIFDLAGDAPKYAKLKCPHCQTKDWCKIERK